MPTVIVTGASRGLGRSIATDLARRGADVVATARSAELLADLADDVDGVEVLAGDITEPATRAGVVDLALARFGSIDGLVNNAGTLDPVARMHGADADDWATNLAVNVTAPVALTALALPALRAAGGRVVNLSSGVANRPVVGWGAYCTAKAALKMATEVLAAEEPDITAVSVRPGVVDTAMQAEIRRVGASVMTPEGHERFLDLYETGELLDPAVPGSAIAALALHAPASMSGAFVSWDDDEVLALGS